MIKCLVIFSTLILLFGCTKKEQIPDEEEPEYKISGHLYLDCDENIANDVQLVLIQWKDAWGNGSRYDFVDETVTSSDGSFEFNYKDNGGDLLTISCKTQFGYSSMLDGVNNKANLKNVDVYFNRYFNANLYLDVHEETYTNLDTIIAYDYDNNKVLRFHGPFKDMLLYKVEKLPLLNETYPYTNFSLGIEFQGDAKSKGFLITKVCSDTNRVYITLE